MLDQPRLRDELLVLKLVTAHRQALVVVDDELGAAGALVDRSDEAIDHGCAGAHGRRGEVDASSGYGGELPGRGSPPSMRSPANSNPDSPHLQ